MQLSSRITGLLGGGSDGWGVFLRARQMIEQGTQVTELTIGEHDIRTAAPILQDMHRAALAGHTGYAAIPGTTGLRDAVAARLQERTGVPTTRDNVLITPGGQSALFAAHMATCNPGDTALYIDPYYATYPGTIRGVSALPHAIAARAEDAFQPRADVIAAAAKQTNAASLLVNSPNNPTGVVYSRKTLEGIAQVCRDHDMWLISDEVYDTQVWEGAHLSPRALDGMAEHTLVVGSMSKSHAMTGSRCGWIVGPVDAIEHLTNLATHTTYGVPGYIQDAALFALNQGTGFETEIAAPFQRRRLLAQDILARQNAVSLVPAQGAMYLMLDVRSTGMSGEDFAYALLEKHHIAVMPGESFGTAAAGHIRVAMTIEDTRFAQALATVCDFAESLAA
ncbi:MULTISPECIES: pyridoxal phosphate-dependent aminotransferase [Sulfitobacter]|mgnify:FL=1|jgi:arginine:pyruvate transaminase|uniref:aspartate transaminase n=4 Tax=Sulfitobacter TaxID=60136 RepID=A0AAX3AES7_9RHOB|nr:MULTISPECIES: pyridoxal phosphate-dependent aminotransferase [Sulfitobacter]MAN09869.1 aspartate aminotransferase [Roseobacter sp.]HBU55595.1 aspartate aminotransferase [Sulfitobacter sp.]QLL42979.1 pyridoxal phosphate-dependent aminotransferase [Sulfitobacter pontiacus]UOA23705.1 Arginine--pyruvate transaminase AruH [Sulfitobacter pontiacus]WPZ24618.1 pyridoxal phosphate-dependent aminotransferase [Sulfitobacter pontiacus]|tara:strand:+ start:1095 stop:2273 length:1179 start_codon:yes stop_codon:yes gene_type:complete